MSSRNYDIFMFEVALYVTHVALGFLQVVNCGSPSWTTTEKIECELTRLPMKFV